MITVCVKNYQSVEEAELVIDGFTTLTGESNRGKSAIVRAFIAALSNKTGTEHITVGKEECHVRIENEKGPNGPVSVEWTKSKKGTSYKINGSIFNKVGRSTPDELRALGIWEIETGDHRRHWPQIQRQKENDYIVGEPSPSVTSELIGASEDTAVVTRAIKLAKEDSTRLKAAEEVLEGQKKETETRVAGLVVVAEELRKVVVDAEIAEVDRNKCQERVTFLGGLNEDYFRDCRALEATIDITGLVLPKKPSDLRYLALFALYGRFQGLQRVLDVGYFSEELISVSFTIKERVGLLERLERDYTKQLLVIEEASFLGDIPFKLDLSGSESQVCLFEDMRRQYQTLISREASLSRDVDSVSNDLKSVTKQKELIQKRLGGLDYCPLCGSKIERGFLCQKM